MGGGCGDGIINFIEIFKLFNYRRLGILLKILMWYVRLLLLKSKGKLVKKWFFVCGFRYSYFIIVLVL